MTDDNKTDVPARAIRELKQRSNHRQRDGVIWLLIGTVMGGMMYGLLALDDKVSAANKKVDGNVTIIEQQGQWIKQQQEQFEECKGKKGVNNPKCVKPIVPPVTLTPQRVESSPEDKSLSEEQVKAIATTVVANSTWSPTIEQTNAIARIAYEMIPKQPTPSQLQNMLGATVATYCANDRCKGKDAPTITPAPGKDGTPGADSTVAGPRGEPGQNATDEQVKAGVAAYCAANNNCEGPVGRGIASLVCQDDGTLLATYDKPDAEGRTTQVIANSQCKVEPQPTVTVTTTTTETVPPDPPVSVPAKATR